MNNSPSLKSLYKPHLTRLETQKCLNSHKNSKEVSAYVGWILKFSKKPTLF